MIVWTWLVTTWTMLLHWWPWLAAAAAFVVSVVVVTDLRAGRRRGRC